MLNDGTGFKKIYLAMEFTVYGRAFFDGSAKFI